MVTPLIFTLHDLTKLRTKHELKENDLPNRYQRSKIIEIIEAGFDMQKFQDASVSNRSTVRRTVKRYGATDSTAELPRWPITFDNSLG